ncbi:unnamed protein product [Arctogadus glacialis]
MAEPRAARALTQRAVDVDANSSRVCSWPLEKGILGEMASVVYQRQGGGRESRAFIRTSSALTHQPASRLLPARQGPDASTASTRAPAC